MSDGKFRFNSGKYQCMTMQYPSFNLVCDMAAEETKHKYLYKWEGRGQNAFPKIQKCHVCIPGPGKDYGQLGML